MLPGLVSAVCPANTVDRRSQSAWNPAMITELPIKYRPPLASARIRGSCADPQAESANPAVGAEVGSDVVGAEVGSDEVGVTVEKHLLRHSAMPLAGNPVSPQSAGRGRHSSQRPQLPKS